MRITRRQLRGIIRESLNEWFLSKKKENTIDKALAGMRSRGKNRDRGSTEEDPEDELLDEGFFGWAGEKLGGLTGLWSTARAKAMDTAKDDLKTALLTYAMSDVKERGEVPFKDKKMDELITSLKNALEQSQALVNEIVVEMTKEAEGR